MTDRSFLMINAVDEVISFDEVQVCLSVDGACLTVVGSGLSVSSLSLENGEISIRGRIDQLVYQDEPRRRKGIGRLFGA